MDNLDPATIAAIGQATAAILVAFGTALAAIITARRTLSGLPKIPVLGVSSRPMNRLVGASHCGRWGTGRETPGTPENCGARHASNM